MTLERFLAKLGSWRAVLAFSVLGMTSALKEPVLCIYNVNT